MKIAFFPQLNQWHMITVISSPHGNIKVIGKIQFGLDQKVDVRGYYNSEIKKFKGATTLEPHPSLKLLEILQDEYTVDITTSITFWDVLSFKLTVLTQKRNMSSKKTKWLKLFEDICVVTLLWVPYVMPLHLVFSKLWF